MVAHGFDLGVDEEQWSVLLGYVAQAAGIKAAVFNGLNVTVSATRQAAVTGGVALFGGVIDEAVPAATLTLASTSVTHVDTVVAIADWTANTVTIGLKPGASTTPAALTQRLGVRYEMPLAYVTVPTGTTAMTVVPCKPLPGAGRTFRGSAIAADQMLAASSGKSLSTLSITDPGRPYQLDITARLRLSGDTGTAQLQVMAGGVAVAGAFSSSLSTGATVPIVCVDSTATMTGPVSLDMRVSPVGASSPMNWGGGGNNNFLLVQQRYV